MPDRGSTRWRRVEPDDSWVIDDPDFDRSDIGAAVRRLHARPVTPPIQVGIVDRHLLVRIDHGVGDMGLIFEIVAALSQPGGPTPTGFVDPAPTFGLRRPVSRIVARQLADEPKATLRAVQRLLGERLRRPDPAAATHVLAGEVASSYSVFVRSDDDYLGALTSARRRASSPASVSALLARAVAEEMSTLHPGLDDVHVVVSLRGRLAGDRDAAGNLTAVVTVPVRPPSDFATRFDALVRSAEVPVKLALSLVQSAVARRTDVPAAGGPSLSISNLTRAATAARIGWDAEPAERICAVGAPLTDRGALAVVLAQVGSQVQATVHFDAAVHDPALVEKALARALSGERWAG